MEIKGVYLINKRVNCINFIELCEKVLDETRLISLEERLQFVASLGERSLTLRKKYTELIQAEPNKARKLALDNKRKIELYKYRNQLAQYLTRNNLVRPLERQQNDNWLNQYMYDNYGLYDGLSQLTTDMLGKTIPTEPDPALLPPVNNLPLAIE